MNLLRHYLSAEGLSSQIAIKLSHFQRLQNSIQTVTSAKFRAYDLIAAHRPTWLGLQENFSKFLRHKLESATAQRQNMICICEEGDKNRNKLFIRPILLFKSTYTSEPSYYYYKILKYALILITILNKKWYSLENFPGNS